MKRRRTVRQHVRTTFKRRTKALKQRAFLIPYLFTLANIFFGFVALIAIAYGEWESAAYSILVGGLMDALDGRIARFVGGESAGGMYLDSLADAISFCCAPALLVYTWHIHTLGILGFGVAVTYLMCGVLRLVRFTVISSRVGAAYFEGLPSTIAGMLLVLICLFSDALHVSYQWFVLLVLVSTTILAVLMMSTIPFVSFKEKRRRRKFSRRHTYPLAVVGVCAILTIMRFEFLLLLMLTSYVLYSVGRYSVETYRYRKNVYRKVL